MHEWIRMSYSFYSSLETKNSLHVNASLGVKLQKDFMNLNNSLSMISIFQKLCTFDQYLENKKHEHHGYNAKHLITQNNKEIDIIEIEDALIPFI